MNVTIINDCRDDNAKNRQISRTNSFFNCNVSFVGVDSDTQAAGNIIDTLDALGDSNGLILVNVAPRNGKSKQWENGTPFAYFWYKNILVLTSIEGHTLSLVKKFNLIDKVKVLDIEMSLLEAGCQKDIAKQVAESQFRSFDFLPRIAKYIFDNQECEGEDYLLSSVEDVKEAIWWIDNFGNCKTTVLPDELTIKEGHLEMLGNSLPFYEQLKSVKDDELAAVIGSSGLADKRFIEIVKQGGRAIDYM